MLKLYNTLSGQKEEFKPIKNKRVNLFVCGPTVYDSPHIGHARTYIAYDVMVKYLRKKGYKVSYLQNITDIDDKIINRAKEKGVLPKNLALEFEKEYKEAMANLKVTSVSKYARATDHIKEIIGQVKKLLDLGFGYRLEDGIYYDISKFRDYGKLSKRTALQAEDAVSRIDECQTKRNRGDFCLWKLSPLVGQETQEPAWDSPWGRGRPGWHIEDTSITEKYFGPQYDAHGGARDLIFPHHEAEIAQMEAISGKFPLVRYWIHTGFLTVCGQKMSKSLGNFITIKDFLAKNSSRILRLFSLKNHYRSPIDFSEDMLSQTKEESDRIAEFAGKLKDNLLKKNKGTVDAENLITKTKNEFTEAMEDDFNTPKALASIFNLVAKGNILLSQNKIGSKNAKNILKLLGDFDEIIDIELTKSHYKLELSEKITLGEKQILELAQKRNEFRKQKNWEAADEIRKEIEKSGYEIEDTEDGPKIKKI